jgi:hypothetical protein
MSDLEMPDEETATADMDGGEAADNDDTPRAKNASHRQSALRDLSRARKQMRTDEAGGGAELLLQSAMVKALLDLADAIREGGRTE